MFSPYPEDKSKAFCNVCKCAINATKSELDRHIEPEKKNSNGIVIR